MNSLSEVFRYFLRLGIVGFGGPLALVTAMQQDLVEKRRWMTPETFSKSFALIKAMPGPIAFMTAVFLGHHRAGWKGGLAAAIGLIGPAFVMMVLFAFFYNQWRGVSGVGAFFSGMQAAALGVILAGLRGLSKPHKKKPIFWVLAVFAAVMTFISPAYEPVLILGCGGFTILLFQLKSSGRLPSSLRNLQLSIFSGPPVLAQALGPAAVVGAVVPPSHWELAWSCFKSGAFVFGSGLAIVPLMEHDFVSRLGWLTHQEFMDALAFGQVTPGPVVITATFIGFRSLGVSGAGVATIAIFAAPFFHMTTWFPRLITRLSQLAWVPAFLTGAIAAVVGAIFATTMRLSLALEQGLIAYALILAALAISVLSRFPVWALIPLGGVAGLLASLLGY